MSDAEIEFDEAKRQATLSRRGLDFADAGAVFAGSFSTKIDRRHDYGEVRYQTMGRLFDDVVMIVWTQRGPRRRVISMRKCNADERDEYFAATGVRR